MRFIWVKKIISALAFCSVVLLTTNALALTLPPPNSTDAIGVPVASSHDDFYTYSAALLVAMTNAGNLTAPYIYTAADFGNDPHDIYLIANNVNVPNGGFPQPLNSPGSDPEPPGYWTGTWPAGNRVAVNDLLLYLQNNTGCTVPVFMFNMNQTADSTLNQGINIVGAVRIFDAASGGTATHTWSLDDTLQSGDGNLDPLSWVNAPGRVGADISGFPYTAPNGDPLDANLGNAYDYLAYSPTLDLKGYQGKYLEFFIGLDGVNDGPEYIAISGAFCPTPVPEPASMLLFGMGLVGLAGARRFRRK